MRAFTAVLTLGTAALSYAVAVRGYVLITGSSTAYPFAKLEAERMGQTTEFRSPRITAFRSVRGIRQFCRGVGPSFPDMALASRQMKSLEVTLCHANRMSEIVAVVFGYRFRTGRHVLSSMRVFGCARPGLVGNARAYREARGNWLRGRSLAFAWQILGVNIPQIATARFHSTIGAVRIIYL